MNYLEKVFHLDHLSAADAEQALVNEEELGKTIENAIIGFYESKLAEIDLTEQKNCI